MIYKTTLIAWTEFVSRNRFAANIDKNQPEIVKALRKIPGVEVELNHDDILVGYQGKTFWYELKNEDAVSKRTGKIKQSAKKSSQIKLEAEWTGHYKIVSSLQEILDDIFGGLDNENYKRARR